MCVQDDDITPLLPVIDQCDAIVVATPIYNQQITSQAKLFLERLYPFFHLEKKNCSNTAKFGKKAAVVSSFWGSPKEVMEKYTVWTAKGFSQMGAEDTRGIVFDGIPEAGQIKERSDYMRQLHELAKWLAE